VRCLIFIRHILGEDAKTKLGLRELLLIFQEVINEIKAEMKTKGREDDFAGLKVSLFLLKLLTIGLYPPQIIYSALRIVSPEALETELDLCAGFKREFPDLIAGKFLSEVSKQSSSDGSICQGLISWATKMEKRRNR